MTDPLAVDPATLKLGLLLETAQNHQELAEDSLKRLVAHTQGLDGVVRDEIRRAVIAELAQLVEHSDRAAESLRKMSRAVQVRTVWTGAVLGALPALLASGFLWWWLPSPGKILELRSEHQRLTDNLRRLEQLGGRIDLRHCGNPERLCVRVDRALPAFGPHSDYLIVEGY